MMDFIPFFPWCEEHDFEDRICTECGEHVRTADGPFAEGDRTKTLADIYHWETNHS